MFYTVLSIVGGLIAASSLILAKQPNAKAVCHRLAPYQGVIGLVMLVAGVLWLLQILPNVGSWLSTAPLRTGLTLGALTCTVLVGLLLGYGLLAKFALSKNEAAKEKGARLQVKLATVQAPLGLLTVGLGIASLVM